MRRTTKVISGLLGACGLFSSNLYAVENGGVSVGAGTGFTIGGDGVSMGAARVYPSLGVGMNYEDNIYATDTNEKSSWVVTISPGIKFETRQRANTYSVAYKADIIRFLSSSDDNTVGHDLTGTADLSITSKAGLKLKAQYLEGADRKGSTDRAFSDEPDEWHSIGVGGVFAYGSPGARGRIELELDHVQKRYDNNRAVTETGDVDETTVGATFFWRVMPKTSALFQVQQKEFDYKKEADLGLGGCVPPYGVFQNIYCGLDSTERRYLVGVTWDATAKTTGIAKIGYLEKDFDSEFREDFDGTSWEVGVKWRPKTYSNFAFTTGRETEESTGVGDTIVSSYIGAAWNHKWNGRFATTANIKYAERDYESQTQPLTDDRREDDVTTVGIQGMYQFRRWLGIGPNLKYIDFDSNTVGEDSTESVVGISIRMAL